MHGKVTRKIVTSGDRLAREEVGGKFAQQRRMAARGLPVPPFFCLTTACYDEVIGPLTPALRRELQGLDWSSAAATQAAAAAIRGRILEASLPGWLEREALAAFDALFAAETLVSVRASTVGRKLEESEDSADNPFAGMSDSFLFVPRGEVLEHVRRCWASGFSHEAMMYRQAQGMDVLGFAVAVGVQRMVFGERSFVLFTCDPKSSARDPVIVAGHGVGEGIVQDRVAVDHYFVSRRDGAIRRALAHKAERVVLDEAAGRGLVTAPVPEALRDGPCLTDDEVRALASYGEQIEQLFGCPQDIEGTFTADGQLHLLQARPIALDYTRQRVWSNANVSESYPGTTTALTYSFARFFYREIFYDCYRRLGVTDEQLRLNMPYLDKMIGFLGGKVYYNLTSFYHLHQQSPLFPVFRGHWEQLMGFASSYQTEAPLSLSGLWGRALGGARISGALVNVLFNYATHERQVQAFHAWWEGLIAPLRGRSFEGDDPVRLIGEFYRVWGQVASHWGVTLLNDTYLPMVYGLAEQLFERWGLAADEALLSDLLCGDEQLLSVQIILSAVALAEHVRADPTLTAAFAERPAEALWSEITRERLDPAFCRAVRRHLHDYGDRGLQELKVEQPNLRHTPEKLLQAVASYVRSGVSVAAIQDKELAVREAAERRLEAALRGRPERLAVVRYVLGVLRKLIRNRENSRYCRSELFGVSKNIFRALGLHLARRDVLREADDVYHLALDELFGYFDGTGVTEDLQALADLRRGEFEANRGRVSPEQVTTLGPVRENALFVAEEAEERPDTLRGLGSSTGRVRGRARVVLEPDVGLDLGEDAILVARETDPGWLFLMLAAKGIVVERGSMLSHTAITGRKFNIPTVVAVPRATTRIPEGALLEIDGASGLVRVLEDGA